MFVLCLFFRVGVLFVVFFSSCIVAFVFFPFRCADCCFSFKGSWNYGLTEFVLIVLVFGVGLSFLGFDFWL